MPKTYLNCFPLICPLILFPSILLYLNPSCFWTRNNRNAINRLEFTSAAHSKPSNDVRYNGFSNGAHALRFSTIHTSSGTSIFGQNGFATQMTGSRTQTELYSYRHFYGDFRNPRKTAHRLPSPTSPTITENTEFRQFSDGRRHALNTRIDRTQCDPNIIVGTWLLSFLDMPYGCPYVLSRRKQQNRNTLNILYDSVHTPTAGVCTVPSVSCGKINCWLTFSRWTEHFVRRRYVL